MSRQYPLARLLRLRKMREDQAANDLAIAQRRQAQAEEKVRRAQEELAGSDIEGGFSEAVWRSNIAAHAARRSMMLEAMGLAKVATEETDAAHDSWMAARQQSRPLEKLEEKFNEQLSIEEARAENIVLDEIAQNVKKDEIEVTE